MTSNRPSHLDATRFIRDLILGAVAVGLVLGPLALAQAASDRLLNSILDQLRDMGKKVKSTQVVELAEGEAVVTVILVDGEVRKYDDRGRLQEVKDKDGKVTRYEEGMPVEERDASGDLISRTKYFRSSQGTVLKLVKTGRAGTETKSFDPQGNIIQITNAQGTKFYSQYEKNSRGKTTSYVEREMGTGKTYRVFLEPDTGSVQSKVDENGVRTDIEYQRDAQGEIVTTTERDTAGHVKVKHFKNGQLVESVEDGVRTLHDNLVDDKGQLVRKTERKLLTGAGGQAVEDVAVKDFDESGRVVRLQDKTGTHTYTYAVDENGRVRSRFEHTVKAEGGAPVEKTTYYDLAGRVIGIKEEGQETKTSYVLDDKGNILSSLDTVTISVGPQSFTQQIRKEYDGNGRVTAKTDDNGLRTEYTYDAKGNRIRSENEFELSHFAYDEQGNLVSSLSYDHKSMTFTRFDVKTKLPDQKVKIKNSGVVEPTSYSVDDSGLRISQTLEAFGVRTTTYLGGQSEQPQQVVFTKNNGLQTVSHYDYVGEHLVASRETGPGGSSQTLYNAYGKPYFVHQEDKWGRAQQTTHQYARGRLTQSLMVDRKGKTTTDYNKFEDPVQITRINQIGFPRRSVEERTYTDGILTESVSRDVKGRSITTFDVNELADTVHRVNHHGFPRQNWVKNVYNTSGELAKSFQRDSRGITRNNYDGDGLMEDSERIDVYGFPKRKFTTYQYQAGELVTSVTDDQRGTAYNKFDEDGLMRETRRVKKFGFPREEFSNFEYDSNGYMTYSESRDANGTTQNYYNIDELVVVSYRENKYGHARQQWTVNEYDDEGFMTVSKETDLKGATITQFNRDALATENLRLDHYGVVYGRNTITTNDYDWEGFLTRALSKNLLTTMEKEFDRDALVQFQMQQDNFGVLDGRYKESYDFEYDGEGRLLTNTSTDDLGTTYSDYDIHGDAVRSRRVATIGLEASRQSFTQAEYEADTGMTTARVSRSLYGITTSHDFDPVTGLESRQVTNNYFGLLATRLTESRVDMDIRHGLTRETLATNAYGRTHTTYDTVTDGPYGVAVASRAINNFGLGYTLDTATVIEADIHTGQNLRTKAQNRYGTTLTEYDSVEGGRHGVATRSYTFNNFGLIATEETYTAIQANTFNGLNEVTVGRNAYGTTVTRYESGETGVALESNAENNFGLGKTLRTHTEITANIFNGLNRETLASNAYGTTLTRYDEQISGVALESDADNNYGLEASRKTRTAITANRNNGLNQETVAVNEYGTTTTEYDDEKYGTAEESLALNNFGLGATRETRTKIYANVFNGLNELTLAANAYGTTVTRYDHQQSGVAEESMAYNNFGLGATRQSRTVITASHDTGLNEKTVAVNEYGATTTFYDDTYGLSVESWAENNFGLGATLVTHTAILGNVYNGLNQVTTGENDYGRTVTYYDDREYGVSLHSDAANKFGILASRRTGTDIDANTWNGLNRTTVARNAYGKTTTTYDDAVYGVSVQSRAENVYGLGASRDTDTLIQANTYNGLNQATFARNAYGETTTLYDDQQSGVSLQSYARNQFGLGATRETLTDIQANTYNGLNEQTYAVNEYGATRTIYDSEEYGVATASYAVNRFGLGATLESQTQIAANVENGLNDYTYAVSAYSSTLTLYDNEDTGVAVQSLALNNYGLLDSRFTHTLVTANHWNGLNQETLASNAYGQTRTYYDSAVYGVATASDANNNVGIGATRQTHTDVTANTWNGLNQETVAVNRYGTTRTEYDQHLTGVALNSVADNHFGLGASRHSETDISANTYNGLNQWTLAASDYGWTYTEYDDDRYGVAEQSLALNQFGLKSTRLTATRIDANIENGLNNHTLARNDYGQTYTVYDNEDYGTARWSLAENNYGLLDTRDTFTTIRANTDTGLNQATVAVNAYGTTATDYDSAATGVALASHAENNYGLGASAVTDSVITANTWNGLNIQTDAVNAYGRSLTLYDEAETGVAEESFGWNNYGLGATRYTETDIDANDWNGLNIRTAARNAYALTVTEFDEDETGKAEYSWAENYFGLGSTRQTATQINASRRNGLNISTRADNAYGTTWTFYDEQQSGAAEWSLALNNFGLGASRLTFTDIDANTFNGMNTRTTAVNLYGRTTTQYDDQDAGVAVSSLAENNFGLHATRITQTSVAANVWNGLNRETTATNDYGTTVTRYDDLQYGTAQNSDADNRYGLGATRHTHTDIAANVWNGLNRETTATNRYGQTVTRYDEHETGVSLDSDAANRFGLLSSRDTHTEIEANAWNGLNEETEAVNDYGTTWTEYESEETGVAERSVAQNVYGLGASRVTFTEIDASIISGLNTRTQAVNAFGTTETQYDDDDYGVALFSHAVNNFGLGASKITDTTIVANTETGLNQYTLGSNNYGTTLTQYDDAVYGTSVASLSWNNFGVEDARVSLAVIDANETTGLNRQTTAVSRYSTVTTNFDDAATGVSEESWTTSNYGLVAARQTYTDVKANAWNGLNQETLATNVYGTTYTRYDDVESGVSLESLANNNFGINASRSTYTEILANRENGLNQQTVATNTYGTTTTFYDDLTYGVAVRSEAENNYGLGASRQTTTYTQANLANGLNTRTLAVNDYGWTETFYENQSVGTADWSRAHNNFGLGATRDTVTDVTASAVNGLNVQTISYSAYGTTVTNYESAVYGTADTSTTYNNFGLDATRVTSTDITASPDTGLNIQTEAWSAYSYTRTNYDYLDSGTALPGSFTRNNYGLGATRETTTTKLLVNKFNGLNRETETTNAYGKTTTVFDAEETGLALYSDAANNYGIGLTRNTHTVNNANPWNGLNQATLATNGYGTTITLYDDQTHGQALESFAATNYGLLSTRTTHTLLDARTDNGLNNSSVAYNDYSLTVTNYDGADTGKATSSDSLQNWGLLSVRFTHTDIYANDFTGQNVRTVAANQNGRTESFYKWQGSGVIDYSVSDNNYGAIGSRHATTTFKVNESTGVNEWSFSTAHDKNNPSKILSKTKTFYDPVYGTNTRSESENMYGARLASPTTTTFTTDKWTGINRWSTAVNGLSTTTTEYDAVYGKAEASVADNYRGATFGRHVETIIDASEVTGLNRATYSHSMLSDSWTEYDANGLQDMAVTKMNEGITLGYAVWTLNDYTMDAWTGLMAQSTAMNNLGTTYANYDANGFIDTSWNYSVYGLVYGTYTDYTPDLDTGFNATSVSTAYSAINTSQAISTTTSYYDGHGMAWKAVTSATTGPNSAKVKTSIMTNDIETGVKTYTSTTCGLSDSQTWSNVKGVDIKTITNSYLGPYAGRTTTDWTVRYDADTGIRRESYSESGLNRTRSYFTAHGLPVAGVYQQKRSFYGAAEGAYYEETEVADSSGEDLHWSGNPKKTVSRTAISITENYNDVNGFTYASWAGNMYGAAGDALTYTTYAVNPDTGLNSSSTQYKYSSPGNRYGEARTYSTYDGTFGVATYTKAWNKKGDVTETSTGFNHSTGMTNSSVTTGKNEYRHTGGSFDSNGRKGSATTSQKSGKDSTETYNSTYWYNNWTGLLTKETRSGSQNKTVYYDAHGVENSSYGENSSYPGGQARDVTRYYGTSNMGDPTTAAVTYSGAGYGETVTIVQHDLSRANENQDRLAMMPTWAEVTYNYGNFVTDATVIYNMTENGPIAATVTDNQGSEVWIINNGYEQSAIQTRSRVNNDGSTFTWVYTDTPTGPFHTSADISYTLYMGTHTGVGTETYTSSGILTRQVLNNNETWDETITFQNDGTYVTTATGRREDGVNTSYSYTGVNEIATSSDDKGVTTWDPATQRRTSTTGGLGTFTYTYSGAAVIGIQGEAAAGGQVKMDQYWNLREWTDSKGVVHSYTPATKNKAYVTQATETFTDSKGTVWTGTVHYKSAGFYFDHSTLKATNAKLDSQAADNTVTMDKAKAFAFLKTLIAKYNTEKETFSWKAPDDPTDPNPGMQQAIMGTLFPLRKTLAEYKLAAFTLDDVTGYGDIEMKTEADGTVAVYYNNIRYLDRQFVKKARYRPVVESRTYTVISDTQPATGDYRNMQKYNNKFYTGDIGNEIAVKSSRQVVTGTKTETYFVEIIADDPSTEENEYREIEHAQQAYNQLNQPLYQSRTREVTLYSTQWTMIEKHWFKKEDGWMWVDAGVDSEQYHADVLSQKTVTYAAAPFGAEGLATASATNLRKYRTSSGNKAGGASLAGGLAVPADSGKGRAQGAAEPAQGVAETIGKALASTVPGTMAQAVTDTYQRVFGAAYESSLLKRLLGASLANPVVEEVRANLAGAPAAAPDADIALQVDKNVQQAAEFKRDEQGRVVQAVDQRGLTHDFKYEPQGFSQTIQYGDRTLCVRFYDNDGRLQTENVDGRSRVFNYAADGQMKLTEHTAAGAVTMEYDADGRLLQFSQGSQKTVYQYTNQENNAYTATVFGPTGAFLESRHYQNGKLVSKKTAAGSVVKYDYLSDQDGKVLAVTQEVTDTDGAKTYLKYNSDGRLITATGKHAERVVKMAEEGTLSEAAFKFELLGKDPFEEQRLEGLRLNQQPAFAPFKP